MGWNHWYTWYHRISAEKMKQAADQMIASGMADVGYMYVNIDDCWMMMPPEGYEIRGDRLTGLDVDAVVGKARDIEGRILSNAHFADMEGLVDYIHGRGLRAGLYTSPGPRTCQQYEGSYRHELQDAEQYAKWGFDFLKYDWCSYGKVATGEGRELLQKPYREMGEILQSLERDIILNLCQYGRGDVWEWGGEVGGHCWRTTGDLGLKKGDRLPGFYHIAFSNMQHWQYARPGQWNDPDYILIGWVGVPPSLGVQLPRPTTLTPDEQYSYMSLWCLMAAPLFFSGDMARLDEFTLNVLCNPEVIEVDQDPLGKQGRPIVHTEEKLVLAKLMEDGSIVIGLFNLAETEKPVGLEWDDVELEGPQRVRDLWRHKDLGVVTLSYELPIPRHGVRLIRLWPERE
jgi:alpha-galactosidase